MILGTVISMLLVFVAQFFRVVLDYTSVEHVQFEDDDYYYYVKAVPKVKYDIGKKPKSMIMELFKKPVTKPAKKPSAGHPANGGAVNNEANTTGKAPTAAVVNTGKTLTYLYSNQLDSATAMEGKKGPEFVITITK